MTPRLMQGILMLALTACGSSPSATAQGNERPFKVSPVATFASPWAMAFLPGSGVPLTNAALVTEKPGRIWLVDVASGMKQAVAGTPKVMVSSQGGLLDIAASPDGGQFGGRIAFAPDGQSLFLSSGERQRFTPAQDASQPLGKILHLTLEGKPAAGNPLAGRTGATSVTVTDPPHNTVAAKSALGRTIAWPGVNATPAETWSNGHRNPYGLTFAPDGTLWETEMGPRGGDELNVILPGRNYGWPAVSDGDNYDGVPIADHRSGDGFEPPKLYWNPSISPSSLLIYTGDRFPQWKGDGLIGALSGEALIHVRIRGTTASKAEQWDMGARIRAVDQGPNGEVYLLEDGDRGRLLRLDPVK